MQLSDILLQAMSDEAYLAHQRQLHRERIERTLAQLRETGADIERLRANADAAMRDMYALPGTAGERIHVGTPPAWLECRTGDEEYVWHLNRMDGLFTLTQMYVLTGEGAYAEKATELIEHWIDACPPPPMPQLDASEEDFWAMAATYRGGVHPWRTVEVGLRVGGSWAQLYDRLLLTEWMTPQLHTKLAVSFYEHMKALRHMTLRFFPRAHHNHFLSDMSGLLTACCLFPDIREAADWREVALYQLGRCVENQFYPEGAQIEGSPGYHIGCLRKFLTLAVTAKEFGFPFADSMRALCKRAIRHSAYCVTPRGECVSIGDTGVRLKAPLEAAVQSYRAFGTPGAAAMLFALFPGVDERTMPRELQEAARDAALAAGPSDNDQRTLGQYMARTGWTSVDSYFAFTCGTPFCNGHTHQDVMSFVLILQGDEITVDPSYFSYRECSERKKFKSPEYHSCLTFDGKPPFEYLSRWSYSPQREGHIRSVYHSAGVLAVDASHHNYDPDFHKRLCMLVGDDTFIVADDVANVSGADVRLWFHMSDPQTHITDGVAVNDSVRVLLPEGLRAELLVGERSRGTDLREPTSRICVTDTAKRSRPYITVFTKRADLREPKLWREGDTLYIRYTTDEGTRTFAWRIGCSLTEIE